MKTAGRIFGIICTLAAVGLAIGVAFERQASARLAQENSALRQQLSQMAAVVAENQRLSNPVAQAKGSVPQPAGRLETAPATEERMKELARLRGEVEALRQQSKEIETLRTDTRQVRAAQERALRTPNAGQAMRTPGPTLVNGSPFEIVSAGYWTDKTNLDVADELRARVRSDGLKAIASNGLKGDPDFGNVKHLTVVYRYGGVTRTNEFREDDFVVLPGQ